VLDLTALRRCMDGLVASTDSQERLGADPLGLVHAFSAPEDQEIAGLIAALLAFGNVLAIRKSVLRAFALLGPSPARTIATLSEPALVRLFQGFVHRTYKGCDVARVLSRAARVQRKFGSLGLAFEAHLRRTADNLRESLASLADDLRGPSDRRALSHLVS